MYLLGIETSSPKWRINLKWVLCHWCIVNLIEGNVISICRHDANSERRAKIPFVQEARMQQNSPPEHSKLCTSCLSLKMWMNFIQRTQTNHIKTYPVFLLFCWNRCLCKCKLAGLGVKKKPTTKLKYVYCVGPSSSAMIRNMAWSYLGKTIETISLVHSKKLKDCSRLVCVSKKIAGNTSDSWYMENHCGFFPPGKKLKHLCIHSTGVFIFTPDIVSSLCLNVYIKCLLVENYIDWGFLSF